MLNRPGIGEPMISENHGAIDTPGLLGAKPERNVGYIHRIENKFTTGVRRRIQRSHLAFISSMRADCGV